MSNISQIQVGDTSYDIKDNISGYQTAGQVDEKLVSKQDALVSGTNIKTINNQSILGSGNIEIQGGGGAAANNGKLTIQRNGVDVNYFTADQANDTTINILVPANNNELINGAQYITIDSVSAVGISNNYNDLNNKPELSVYPKKTELAKVATSNDYNDLDNKVDLASYAKKSELATVATSGDYNDLKNKYTYTLPNATTSTLGGVKVGSHLSVSNGTLSSIVDTSLSSTSTEAISNKTVKTELDKKANIKDPTFEVTKPDGSVVSFSIVYSE